jgi:transposase
LRRVRPPTGPQRIRRQLASDLIGDIRRLDRQGRKVDRRIKVEVQEAKTGLVHVFGVGDVLAAKIIGEAGNVRRFSNKDTGTAPLEASSGDVVRDRLSRAGNRKLNNALHIVALVQVKHPTEGRAYYLRKRADGKSDKEAIRCLKRRLSDVLFRVLGADLQRDKSRTA